MLAKTINGILFLCTRSAQYSTSLRLRRNCLLRYCPFLPQIWRREYNSALIMEGLLHHNISKRLHPPNTCFFLYVMCKSPFSILVKVFLNC